MSHILFASKEFDSLSVFIGELETGLGYTISRVSSGKDLLKKVEDASIKVVILGMELIDGSSLAAAISLTKKQPLINVGMVSDLSSGDFHEETEGLGIFMQLPPTPSEEDAQKMHQYLESIAALLKGI